METKAHQKFRQKIEFIELYIQTIYSSLENTSKYLNHLGRHNKKRLINGCLKNVNMTRLNQPLTEVTRIFNYSKANICEYYIIELYSAVNEYLHTSISEILNTSPLKILGLSNKSIEFTGAEIIKLGDYNQICNEIVNKIFRELENLQSTKKLLEKYDRTFNVNIPHHIFNDALSFLELRHLIIHNNSIIDQLYVTNFPNSGLIVGIKIPTNFKFVNSQHRKAVDLVNFIDNKNIANKLMKAING